MTWIKIMIKNKKTERINVDLYKDSLNDIIQRIGNITVNLITIGGDDIKQEDFSKKLNNFGLEEDDMILISDYYNGGRKLYLNK